MSLKKPYIAPVVEQIRFGATRHLLAIFSLDGDLEDLTPGGDIVEDSWD